MSLTTIKTITPGSPAHGAGVRPGEILTAINGHRIVDVLDYKYYSYDPELELTLQEGESQRTVSLTKEVGEDLGLEFETYLMDRARSCANKCVFCFVDQLPKGMRDTLYFKDDDARLSFLLGNYITLTNLSKRELQRICDLHISPINISVHATDPEVRKTLLGSKRGGDLYLSTKLYMFHHLQEKILELFYPNLRMYNHFLLDFPVFPQVLHIYLFSLFL